MIIWPIYLTFNNCTFPKGSYCYPQNLDFLYIYFQMEKVTAKEFMIGIVAGDSLVLQRVYTELFPKIRSFIIKLGGSEAEAEDIFQKVILQLSARIKVRGYTLEADPSAYLFQACKNLWYRELNKRKKRKVTNKDVKELYYEPDDMAQSTLEQERWEIFHDKLSEISDNCKQVLVFYFQGMSAKEIMEMMDYQSENTVRQRIFKCKQKLIEAIKSDPLYKELIYK